MNNMDFETVLKSTILEALIEKVANIQNKGINDAAINAFIKIITTEPESAISAVRLITCKIQSPNEWEALQTLHLLESCMQCDCSFFHAEIGKFRFLNELIKLVSPKYLGNSTTPIIKNKIVDLLKQWSQRYPKETKIKEAFEMLVKQGVVETQSNYESHNYSNTSTVNNIRPTMHEEDDEKSKMLQKLLRSNKPSDLKAANHLIKTMVKEKEEKEDLRLIANNAKLLSEMLSNVSSDSSVEEIELIKELKETCVNMKPTLAYLISCCNKTTKNSADLFKLNDLLNDTLVQYHGTVQSMQKRTTNCHELNSSSVTRNVSSSSPTLLDLSSPIDDVALILPSQPLKINANDYKLDDHSGVAKNESAVDTLEEVFSSNYSVGDNYKIGVECSVESGSNSSTSTKLFQDLNVLGKSFLELNMSTKTSLNDVPKITLNDLATKSKEGISETHESISSDDQMLSEDDDIVNGDECAEDFIFSERKNHNSPITGSDSCTSTDSQQVEFIAPLSDVYVPLVDIKTEGNEKLPIFEDPNGINVYIQLTKNKPRRDVSVFLVLCNSRRTVSISNFLFQPVVSKDCRLKLQSASKSEFPPFNPHLPVETIVQIMLIASLNKESIPMKFVISYNVKEETITELGEVLALPLR